jgi:hypothetical protein
VTGAMQPQATDGAQVADKQVALLYSSSPRSLEAFPLMSTPSCWRSSRLEKPQCKGLHASNRAASKPMHARPANYSLPVAVPEVHLLLSAAVLRTACPQALDHSRADAYR